VVYDPKSDNWMRWRKLRANSTTYLSAYPAETWKIVKAARGWSVQRAAKDGDRYVELHQARTLSAATKYANRWPEDA
jgi:hypothetical protein